MRKAFLIATIFTLALAVKGYALDDTSLSVGSVNYSTVSWTTSRTFINDGDTSFEGLIIDSVSAGDLGANIIIVDTTSVKGLTNGVASSGNSEAWRVYISSSLTSGGVAVANTDASGGLLNLFYKPPMPIRMHYGLAVTPSSASIKKIIVLWRKLK